MRSDEFIDLYKQLEDELEVKFSTAKQRRYSSVVFEYINHYESAPVRETLNLCREIRNLMTHNANLGGELRARGSRGGSGGSRWWKHCGRHSTTFAVRRLHSTLRQKAAAFAVQGFLRAF